MKYQYVLFFLAVTALCSSCGKEGAISDSFFRATVAGPSWNGSFEIKGGPEDFVGQALITPSGDPAIPDLLFMSYGDSDAGLSVNFTIPAEKRVTELTEDHEVFGMGMIKDFTTENEVLLISKTVSMDLKTLKTTNTGVLGLNIPSKVVGSFTGVMIHEYYDMNGVKIQESHLVDGNFEFYQ